LRWLKPQDGLALVRLDALAMDLPVVVRETCEPGEALVVRVKDKISVHYVSLPCVLSKVSS
jgi:hypothetical protein